MNKLGGYVYSANTCVKCKMHAHKFSEARIKWALIFFGKVFRRSNFNEDEII